ncbi:MAG: cysteine--tRNA ligase [Candidatus Omnitrophica bacterium]|jgi:cysteinyl-tRNA synthetase|nr:cysteine--tRNA ligase [Candidatus Omnitrophota bacterium]
MLKINNTLTRQKDEFKPQSFPQVTMYTCGVTVYDDCHIGHARSLYIFDVMRRYLKYKGYDVKFVRNITDIDDKIINRAIELKINWQELVKKYIDRYYEDLNALGVEKADFEPRATENIPDMIKYIQTLIDKEFAYASGGDVYFNVRKFSEYGKLSGQKIEEMEAGARISPTGLKKDHLDFALWKASKEGEPFWESPWGNGRPGWHIECSVMSQKFLKTDTLDIHAGGRDLVFPHHENELAQAEAFTGKPFARYWIHHGLLTINGQKMSKSLGNFIIVKDVLSKYPADVLKILYLQALYSSPVDFSWEKMDEAKHAYERFVILFQKINRKFDVIMPEISASNSNDNKFIEEFDRAMADDFNTPMALSVLFNMVNECNKLLDNNASIARQLMITIKQLGNVLGLSFKGAREESSEVWIMDAIGEREKLRKEKKYKEADGVRKMLEEKGIVLEDTKEGTTWRKKL